MISKSLFSFILALAPLLVFAQSNQEARQTFRDCPECPEMVIIPPGKFEIGSPQDEPGRFPTEGPQKTITVKKIAVGKFHITRGQWAAFVKATNRMTPKGCSWSGLIDTTKKAGESNPNAAWNNLGFPQDDNHPVVCITWFDAQDYISWLSMKTGGKYRLLTEAEWEYAARAGTITPYWWGSTASHEYANYGSDSDFSGLAHGRDKWKNTSPVGSFPPNAFGLYDMHGNVLQMVEDCFEENYADLPVDASAYKKEIQLKMSGRFSSMNETSSCSYRMCRGGDWGNPPAMIRSAFRNWLPGPGSTLENYRSGGVGFRVAKAL